MIFSVLLTAIIVGGGVYVWQKSLYEKQVRELQRCGDDLLLNAGDSRGLPGQGPQSLPSMLSGPGVDSSGRKITAVEIPVSSDAQFLGASPDDKEIKYSLTGISRYKLETPVGVAPAFVFEQPGERATEKYIVDVPKDQDIVVLSTVIANLGKNPKFLTLIDPQIRLLVNGRFIAPSFGPTGNLSVGGSLKAKFLFKVDRNIQTMKLIYGGEAENPAGALDIDFSNAGHTKTL